MYWQFVVLTLNSGIFTGTAAVAPAGDWQNRAKIFEYLFHWLCPNPVKSIRWRQGKHIVSLCTFLISHILLKKQKLKLCFKYLFSFTVFPFSFPSSQVCYDLICYTWHVKRKKIQIYFYFTQVFMTVFLYFKYIVS